MKQNRHYEYAESAHGAANASAAPEFNADVRADALIQATLALAYEQRTANLIELFAKVGGSDQMGLAGTIRERLGLS